jgi:hypothetical protein
VQLSFDFYDEGSGKSEDVPTKTITSIATITEAGYNG